MVSCEVGEQKTSTRSMCLSLLWTNMAMSVLSSLCHLSFSLTSHFPFDGGSGSVGSGAALLSSGCSLPCFQQLFWEPDGKPGSLSQPQTLKALSLPFFQLRFVVGCGGGGVMSYLSHASFVSGIIISPFLVVGSVRQTSGLSLNMTFPSS